MAAGTAVRSSFLGDLAVIVTIDDVKFSHTDIIDMVFLNRLNEQPSGYFRIMDSRSQFVKPMSNTYGTIVFTNTSDSLGKKMSALDFNITDMKTERVEAGNAQYLIHWKAGVNIHNKKITRTYKGNSIKVMADIFAMANVSNKIKFPTTLSQPVDDMNWITPQSNMWEQLDTVVSKSYRQNDYIFWAWDDVNNTFKISSFQVEKQLADRYLIIESDKAIGSTKDAMAITKDDSLTIWQFDNSQSMNRLGLDKEKIFPNIAFSGIVDGDVKSTGFRQKSFVEILKDNVKDDKIEEIIAFEETDEITYGDLILRRHWINNTHKMYSFADTYRDYKLATHAKQVETQIYNNMGPPLGSKVTFLKADNSYRSGSVGYDKLFSDKYIIIEKVLTYNVKSPNISSGGTTMTSANFIMKLKLVSDNFSKDTKAAEENTRKIRSKIE